MKEKSNEELWAILEHANDYIAWVVEAAREELHNRGMNPPLISDRKSDMQDENDELDNYIMHAPGISRKGLNIMCFIGVFVFGWLLQIAFDALGKKARGWFYLVPIIGLLAFSRVVEPTVGSNMLAIGFTIYIIGWVDANLLLNRYQAKARIRLTALDIQQQPHADILLEKGLLNHKVLGDKQSALKAFVEALAVPIGESSNLFNRAGVLLLEYGMPQEALVAFDRALSLSNDPKEMNLIKKNREAAGKKANK